MEIEFLGTGTSTGIPQIGCDCEVCHSTDPHDKRLRTSAMIHTDCGEDILIDCGPDFRTQILRARHNQPRALLVTHSHYDHVGGIDDLRPFCAIHKFPVYAREDVLHDIRTRLPYCFKSHPYPGVPSFDVMLTPAIWPPNASSTLPVRKFSMFSADTDDTDPVRSPLLIVP